MSEEQTTSAGSQDTGTETTQEQGAELGGDTLMTKPAEAGADDANSTDKDGTDTGKDGEKESDKNDPADKVPDKPEGYDLKFAEGTQVDTELLSGFQAAAHELGLSQTKAQALAAMYEAHAAKAYDKAAEAQQQAIETAKTQWETEIQASPTFMQEREHIQAALRQYGDKELYDLLDQTNLGAHPKMWAFMAKIGKTLAEPGFVGKNSREPKSAADVMYPNQGK